MINIPTNITKNIVKNTIINLEIMNIVKKVNVDIWYVTIKYLNHIAYNSTF